MSEPQAERKTSISIPESLYEAIARENEKKGFGSVEDYVVYVLRVSIGNSAVDTTDDDQRRVEARLKSLGYI